MTISAWRQQLLNGEVSSRELVDEQLELILSVEPQIHAFVLITADRARADADRIDAPGRQAMSSVRWPEFPWPSKTTSAPAVFAPPVRVGCWRRLCLRMSQR